MASALPAQPPASGSPPFPIARFSVDQYHRMIQSGAFTEDDRFELIEGWVVTKMAKGPAHEYVTGRADEILRELVPRGWHVRNQAPITLGDSEPEPDLSIARGERGAFRDRHPGASDVALVVEVSDTTLATDRLKARVYAASGIAEYWIVNLSERCVEVYRRATGTSETGYATCAVLLEHDGIRLELDGTECGTVSVAALLP